MIKRILILLFLPLSILTAQVSYEIEVYETETTEEEYLLLFNSMKPLFSGFIGDSDETIILKVNIFGSESLLRETGIVINDSESPLSYCLVSDGAGLQPPVLFLYEKEGLPDLKETARLSSLQYCRALIPGLPPWFELGMAYYLENMTLSPEGTSLYPRFNSEALDYFKNELIDDFSLTNTLSTLDYSENVKKQAAESWALFTFLLHTEESLYSRLLWETIAASRLTSYNDYLAKPLPSFERDFHLFFSETMLSSREQYAQLFRLYNAGEKEKLKTGALELASIEETKTIGNYYLGLLSYEKGDFDQAFNYFDSICHDYPETAEAWYSASLALQQKGELPKSRLYRKKAAELNPGRFSE